MPTAPLTRSPVCQGLVTGMIFLFVACASLGVVFVMGDRAVRGTLNDHLATIASAGAAQIDPVAHASFVHRDQQNGPEYLGAVQPLRDLVAALPSVRSFYTVRESPEGLRYVLDSALPGTPVADGFDSQVELNLIVPGEGRAMRRAFESGSIAFSAGPYTDPWGTFVSAYIPVRHSDGRIEAIMGVDVDAADFVARRNVMRSALQMGCLIALMGSISVGSLSFWMHRLRRASAQVIEESRERYRTMADSVPVMVWTSDADGLLTNVNQRWLNFTGRSLEQEIGWGWLANVHPDDREETGRVFSAACAKGEVYSHEYRLRRADGVYRWVHDLGHPRRDAQGEVIGFIGGVLDISDRKHAEMTLALSEHRMRTIIDTALDSVITLDSLGRVMEWNRQAERTFGWTRGEAVGARLGDLIVPPELRDAHESGLRRFTAGGQPRNMGRRIEVPALRKDGSSITVELSISPVTGSEEISFSAFLRDITERKQAEAVTRRSRADADVRLSISMIVQDCQPIDDRVCRALSAMNEMPGLNEGHRLLLCDGRGAFGERPAGYGCDEAEVTDLQRGLCEEALESGRIKTACEADRGWLAVPMRHSGQDIGVLLLAAEGEPELDEHRIETLDRIAEMLAMAVLRERSERALAAERERSEAAARAKSAFLANMSHEIRTPMTAILGFADMLAEEPDGGSPADPQERQELVETIKRNGRHLLCIINDILDVSKIEAGKMRMDLLPTDPSAVVREIVDLFRGTEKARSLDFTSRIDPQLPAWILTDAVRLRQILVNLVGNALKFTESGSVTIDVGWEPSGKLSVAVSDTGPGLSAAQIKRLFRPFMQGDETTTRQFGGTGLGLVIARRLARMLGGDIDVTSTPGEGSTFTVTIAAEEVLRASDANPAPSRRRSAADDRRPLSGHRVLVVEDGPDNQRLIRFLLERAGAEVVIKCNGKEAVDEITAQAPEIPYDLILMDMQMPVMDGYTASRELRSLGCAVPIIAITAHAMDGDRERCESAGCCDYITKPVDRDAFLKICRRWLGAARVG